MAARLFYDKLFEMDPGVRPCFTLEVEEAWAATYGVLASAVKGVARA